MSFQGFRLSKLNKLKEKILEGAHGLFVQYGVRSVSMDDVASRLSVSKKTLYQHFENKDQLVTEAMQFHMDIEMHNFSKVAEESVDAIDELMSITMCMREHVFKMNPSLLFDLKKYHSGAWAVFEDFKKNFIMKQITNNIIRGIKEGFYRPEIDPKVIATLRIETVQLAFDDNLFPRTEFDFTEVQLQLMSHFTHGLLSEKGRQAFANRHDFENKLSIN
ncbi:MAG: AcrR family transcriptional regulator [Marinoscillum sp.]